MCNIINKFIDNVNDNKHYGITKTAYAHKQDDSLATFNRLLEMGYNRGVWHLHESHPRYDICDQYDGKVIDLEKLVSGLSHEAPIFEMSHPNCYKKDVEVYTNEGWKLFKDLNKTELVATINPETLELEWQKPYNYIEYSYKGKLINFKSKNIDISVTPDHRWFVKMSNGDNYKKKKSKKYRFITSNDIINPSRTYKSKEEIKEFNFSRNYGIPIKAKYNNVLENIIDIDGIIFSQEEYAILMGYYLSEGNCTKDRYQINISQYKHKDKMYCDLVNMLNRNNINIRKSKCGIEFNNKKLHRYLNKFGKSFEKYLPKELKELNKKSLNLFIDAYILGDGNVKINNKLKGQKKDSIGRVIFTSSKKLADDLCEVILKAGYSISYKLLPYKGKLVHHRNGDYVGNYDIWKISIKNGEVVRRYKLLDEEYDDKVYCVSVPNETLLVRANGKVLFSGNCRCYIWCYSTTNKDLEYIVVDWRGSSETGRVVDRKDKEERRKDFYRLYDQYEELINNIKTNKYLTGNQSEPESGIYSFDISIYGEHAYTQNIKNQLRDQILEIILDNADKYKIKVDDEYIIGDDYIISTDNSINFYEFSKTDLMDVNWELKHRRKDLQGLITDLTRLEDFLVYTQDKINQLLIRYDSEALPMETYSIKKKAGRFSMPAEIMEWSLEDIKNNPDKFIDYMKNDYEKSRGNGREFCKAYLNSFIKKFGNISELNIYRQVTFDSEKKMNSFIRSIKNGNIKNVGVYWAYKKSHAFSYNSDVEYMNNAYEVILLGKVKDEGIKWGRTAYLYILDNLTGVYEKEITIKNNFPIQIYNIEVKYPEEVGYAEFDGWKTKMVLANIKKESDRCFDGFNIGDGWMITPDNITIKLEGDEMHDDFASKQGYQYIYDMVKDGWVRVTNDARKYLEFFGERDDMEQFVRDWIFDRYDEFKDYVCYIEIEGISESHARYKFYDFMRGESKVAKKIWYFK